MGAYINIGDVWKEIAAVGDIKINISDSWKNASEVYINVGDVWKAVDFGSAPTILNYVVGKNNSTFYLNNNTKQIWAWGNNFYGTLGNNSTVCASTPVSIHGAKKTFCKISVDQNTHAIDQYGQDWAWGDNNYGTLGNNTIIAQSTPVSIHGAKKTFCEINATTANTSAIDKNGQVWSWGRNNQGQLGDNSTVCASTPVSIHGGKKTFCKIFVGTWTSHAIDNNNTSWSWGYGAYGTLGNNTTIAQSTPVSIHGAKKTFCEIQSYNFRSLALDQYGQVWGWGYNRYGKIGNNSLVDVSTPVSIHGNKKTFCKITSGTNHAGVIDQYGQVWSWGIGNSGCLGNNSTSSQRTPVSIHGGKKTFCEISYGGNSSLGITYDGQLWGWGWNYYGQLDNNNTTSVRTPRLINI